MYRISMVVLGLLTQGCAKKSSSCSKTEGCSDADEVETAAGSAPTASSELAVVSASVLPRLGDAGGEGLSGIE